MSARTLFDNKGVEAAARKLHDRLRVDFQIASTWKHTTADDRKAWREDVKAVLRAYLREAKLELREAHS